jgi:hypothetical protein
VRHERVLNRRHRTRIDIVGQTHLPRITGATSRVREVRLEPRDPGLHGKCSTGYLDRFILTNKRVMVVNGIIIRRVAMMQLLRVTDMKYE